MKTLQKSIASILLVGTMTICSSCKKEASETTVTNDQMTVDTLNQIPDTTDTIKDDASDQAISNDNSGSGSAQRKSGTATSVKSNTKDKDGKSLKGYSAPDGTDAENHDGDQYTKNDNTRMPSGGNSIK